MLIATANLMDKGTEPNRTTVPVGYPVENVKVKILGAGGDELGIYGIGELVYQSKYLPLGYWRMPEQTRMAFSEAGGPGERCYRSGDIGRFLPDGALEFLGRRDAQVKIRGYRIELGEVEQVLDSLPGIHQSVIQLYQRNNGEPYLAAYYETVGGIQLDPEDLRTELVERLPDYMAPAYYIYLSKLPLTPNGKIDRKALPEPEEMNGGHREYEAPRDKVEETLAALWKEILGLERVGIHDNFFELGGHSLKAMQMIAALKEYQLTIQDVFKYPTIAKLSSHVKPVVPQSLILPRIALAMELEQFTIKMKRLDNIKPFHEVLYKNCLYNALFPVIFHFGRDIFPILANDVIRYKPQPDQDDIRLEIETLSERSMMELTVDLGLKVKSQLWSEKIVNDLILAVSEDKPVCVNIDCFYEPFRKDTFQKQHWPHWILVFGFSVESQTFDIIEHSDLNNLDYKHRLINFQDLGAAYQGNLANFQKDGQMPTYYEFGEQPVKTKIWSDQQHYQSIFQNHLLANEGMMLDGLKSLARFQKYAQSIFRDEGTLKKKVTELMSEFNEVTKARLSEKYALFKLFGMDFGPIGILEGIIGDWNLIRSVLDRYRMTGVYRPESIENVNNRLIENIQREENYIHQLIQAAQSKS